MIRVVILSIVAVASWSILAPHAIAGLIWVESTNGPLSTTQASPSTFVLGDGTSSIAGSVTSPTNPRDFVTVTIPAGHELVNYVNAAYSSTDLQGFTGFQTGTAISGNILSSATYNGWTHYGTNANNSNGPFTFSAFSSVGDDLLPIMLSQSVPQGAQGFTLPLAGGQSYSFIIQQTGSPVTNYQYDFVVAPVPEPGTMALLGVVGITALGVWGRKRLLTSVMGA